MESLGPSAFQGRLMQRPDPSDLGHPIPLSFVMGGNEVAVIGVTAFIAYRKGFAFTLTMLFADPQTRLTPLQSMHRVKLAQIRADDTPPSYDQVDTGLTFSHASSAGSAGGVVLAGPGVHPLSI